MTSRVIIVLLLFIAVCALSAIFIISNDNNKNNKIGGVRINRRRDEHTMHAIRSLTTATDKPE